MPSLIGDWEALIIRSGAMAAVEGKMAEASSAHLLLSGQRAAPFATLLTFM